MKKSAKVSLGLMATAAATLLGGCEDRSVRTISDYTPSSQASSQLHLPAEAPPAGTMGTRDTRTSGTRAAHPATHVNRTHIPGIIPVPIGSAASGVQSRTPLRSTPSGTSPSSKPSVASESPTRSAPVTRGGFGSTARSSSRVSVSS